MKKKKEPIYKQRETITIRTIMVIAGETMRNQRNFKKFSIVDETSGLQSARVCVSLGIMEYSC